MNQNTQITKIEDKINREAARAIAIPSAIGGLSFTSMGEVMEFAKLMAVSGAAVPDHLQGNPGACLAICVRALRWGAEPFAVAEKSYIPRNGTNIAFESQLIHAVIEANAPIKGRLRRRYEGEGEERRCIVWGTPKDEEEPLEFESQTLKQRHPGHNDKGYVKGSPLWDTKPDLQQFYDTSRDWCRTYYPDILLGIYSRDEMEEEAARRPEEAKDVSPPHEGRRTLDSFAGGPDNQQRKEDTSEPKPAATVSGQTAGDPTDQGDASLVSSREAPKDAGGERDPASPTPPAASKPTNSQKATKQTEKAAEAPPPAQGAEAQDIDVKALHAYDTALAGKESGPGLQKAGAAVFGDRYPDEDSTMGEAAKRLLAAHTARIEGRASPADTDKLAKQILDTVS